jgi:transcriptional regulator with XRE-family HTH domain
MDICLKLRELRADSGLSQREVAERAGMNEKSLSFLETGRRISRLRVEDLLRILKVYGITAAEFFGDGVERRVAPWLVAEPNAILARDLRQAVEAVTTAADLLEQSAKRQSERSYVRSDEQVKEALLRRV